MLFNSYTYILAFLPAALAVFHLLRRLGLLRAALASLVISSLVFYGWWNPIYLLLLVGLTLGNFAVALRIARWRQPNPKRAHALLIAGVAANLAVLGYFKYANFFVHNVDALLGVRWAMAPIVLPLGISFFTFQKIAFLVDTYRGRVDRLDLLEFALFVSFFPQLVAGPIVHHSEVMPQFRRAGFALDLVPIGLTIFAIGLAKKVLLADTAAQFATPVFDAAAAGQPIGLRSAWTGALAYTAQLYFDFSGYSDMAIGAALLFGIRLPINFASPYKATSIVEFWRRWHITLSRFLRDYLYVPLGGNRHGERRRYLHIVVTMVLGGLWHGAAWTFVAWGAMHASYLVVNHLWHSLRARFGSATSFPALEALAGWAITFVAVVAGWVVFRASSLHAAGAMYYAMLGGHGWTGTPIPDVETWRAALIVVAMLGIAWLAPNTQQITGYAPPDSQLAVSRIRTTAPGRVLWRPTVGWSAAVACLVAIALTRLSRVSEFLYFQF